MITALRRQISLIVNNTKKKKKKKNNNNNKKKNGILFLDLCCMQAYIPSIRWTPSLGNINNSKDKFCNDFNENESRRPIERSNLN